MKFLIKEGKANPPWYCPQMFTPQCPNNDTICQTLQYCESPSGVKVTPGKKKKR